uniref:Uncharacterized protein n=1 Tax=Rhizophora mucronata TaxID=61149 RepID=A0A2P2N2N1_RHIMU
MKGKKLIRKIKTTTRYKVAQTKDSYYCHFSWYFNQTLSHSTGLACNFKG